MHYHILNPLNSFTATFIRIDTISPLSLQIPVNDPDPRTRSSENRAKNMTNNCSLALKTPARITVRHSKIDGLVGILDRNPQKRVPKSQFKSCHC